MAPGYAQEAEQATVIKFDRGNSLGTAEYTPSDGKYTFATAEDGGWQLYRTVD